MQEVQQQVMLEAGGKMNFQEKQCLMVSTSIEGKERQEARRLQFLAQRWYYEPVKEEQLNVPKNMQFYAQDIYDDIPLRDEEKEDNSTVATKGSGILVAGFCAKYYGCRKQPDVAELASMACELRYITYEKAKGQWNDNRGINPEFFDKFVPCYYGLIVRRVVNIDEVSKAIRDGKLLVFQVEDSLNRITVTSKNSHYIAVVGDNEKGFFIYDPLYTVIQHLNHNKIFKSLIEAWVVYKI